MEYRKVGDVLKTREGFEDLIAKHADYVGTYYHYAKFLEEQGEKEHAISIYQSGMLVADRMRNRHAYNELLGAYRLALGLEEDDWDE